MGLFPFLLVIIGFLLPRFIPKIYKRPAVIYKIISIFLSLGVILLLLFCMHLIFFYNYYFSSYNNTQFISPGFTSDSKTIHYDPNLKHFEQTQYGIAPSCLGGSKTLYSGVAFKKRKDNFSGVKYGECLEIPFKVKMWNALLGTVFSEFTDDPIYYKNRYGDTDCIVCKK